MSAQGVKKRFGSRRQVKGKSAELDETTVEQHSVSTEGAEDVPNFSNNRRKLGSSRKKRLHPGKDLGVSDGATRNTTEDDPLDTSQVLSTEEVKVTQQIPEEPHRHSELNKQRHERDKSSAALAHHESFQDNCVVFEPRVIAEDAELRAETQPNEELEVNLSQPGGAEQTFDPTEVCDKELNTKPAETEESQRKGGLDEVTPNHKHKEAESSGTEETLETPHWFVATVEKESEPPESFLSGSPSEIQNLNTSHPEADPEPSIPKRANLPEDPHERGADSKVELSDAEDGALHKPGPEQSNPEHREAESSGTETEETPETPHWFVATGTVEKESELTREDEIVVSGPPESFLSGSPSEIQNLNTNHPEVDPEPSIPEGANFPEDLHERDADSKVELSDDEEEEDGELHKPGPELKGLGSLETVAKVSAEDQNESAEMHVVLSESVSCDAAAASSPPPQHVPQTKTDQSESSHRRNDASGADEPQNPAAGQDCEADGQTDEVKFSSDPLHQEHEDLLSELEQSCSSQALQPERDSCWDPQPQESDACLTLIGHRRKLGSSRRRRGGQRAVDSESEPLSQSNPEHREAESSGTGTEETPETPHWFVATGTVEKESELTREDEIVVSEPPESFLSGSPSEIQNLNTSHPEADPEPSIPEGANFPEDPHERGADSKVELSDDEEEDGAMTLMQQMNEMSSNEGELSATSQSEAALLLDCDLQEDGGTAGDRASNSFGKMRKLGSSRRPKGRQHVCDSLRETFNEPKVETTETTSEVAVDSIAASTARMTTVSKEIRDHQPAQKMNPDVSEGDRLQEDTDLSQNVKDSHKTAMTGSDSDIWRTTFHSRAAAGSVRSEGFPLEAPHAVQKDRNPAQHTHDARETGGDLGGEGSAQGQQEPVHSSDTLTQEEAQETSPSPEPTNAESTSSDPSSPLCFQGTISADLAMEEPGEREPGARLDDGQERSKQRRRKMGSTRWTHKNPQDKQVGRGAVTESSNSAQAGGERLERAAEVSWERNPETSAALLRDEADVTSDPQSTHSNLISHTHFEACAVGRSAPASEEGVNPTIRVEGSDLWDGGSSLEPLDDFTAPEAQATSCLIKPSPCSPPASFQSTQDDLGGLDCLTANQDQPLPSAEDSTVDLETVESKLEADEEHKDPQDPDKVAEGGYIKNLEPANADPGLNTEDLHHHQQVDKEAADKRREDSSSERREGPVKGLHLPEAASLQTSEEAPTASESRRQPTTSPETDLMSDKLSSRRRRKLGSHRKPSRPHSQETQTGSDVSSVAEEHNITTGAEDKTSEVDDSEKSSTNTSSSEVGDHVNPVSSTSDLRFAPRTLVHPLVPGSCLSPENQSLSLAGSPGAEEAKSDRYNVIMVGNSNVGKTSFMKRVLNGRFSSDLPSSVGLDMCLWPVMVDGKRVVLQLWDTAGQERFHSVTRQIFHKAHAFLLMYDITSSRSFTAVSYWANCIQEGATENVTILLLGNKSDCAERQVPTQEGEILAKEYAFEFMECSAATGQNVRESLETVARILSNQVKLGEETTALHKEPRQKKSSGCC